MKIPTKSSFVAVAIATLAPSVWVDAATAQSETTTQSQGGLDEIIVTARKREESLQNVPIAVTALSAEDLKNQSVQTVKDIQYQTPSLTVAPTNSDRNNLSITIRGQNLSDTLLALDPAIGIYIDGVNFAKTLGTELATLADVERIEVLKGPQGTLFGRNTTGGALSITTKLPTNEFEGELQARTDIYGRTGGTAIVNVPMGPTLAARIVGSYDRRGTFGKNLIDGRDIGGDLDGGGIRGALKWEPTETVQVVLRGDYSKTSTSPSAWKARFAGAPGGGTTATVVAAELFGLPFLTALGTAGSAGCVAAPTDPACVAANATVTSNRASALAAYIADGQTENFWNVVQNAREYHSRVTSYGGSATVSMDIGETAQIKSITSYRRLKRDTLMDMDGSRFRLLEVNGLTQQKLFAQELQLTGTGFDEKLDWILGGFYSRETGNDGTRTYAIYALNPNLSVNDGDVINKSKAVFGQFTYRLTDQFSFTGGLRYTWDNKTLIAHNRTISESPATLGRVTCNVPSPVSPTDCTQRFGDSWSALSYTAALDYKPTDGTLIYVKTSRGYRSGGFSMRGTAIPETFLPFNPEFVTDYEIGLKTDLLDRRLRVNLAAYRSNYDGIQRSVIVPISGPPFSATVVRNAATARINGFEAEITAKPTDELTLRATGALTDAKYTNYTSGGVDLTHLKFNTTPKWTYTLSAGYDVPFENGPLHLQLDWAWTDDIYFFPDSVYFGQAPGVPDVRGQKAYGLLNGRISKRFEREGFEVAFFVRNALNKEYFAQSVDLGQALGFASGIVGDPRVIGAEASIKF